MFKKLLLSSILFFTLVITIYPSKRENTEIFDFCYALENILSRNVIQKSKNTSRKFNSIQEDIAQFGVKKTKGVLVITIIDQFKTSKNSLLIKLFPNNMYCLGGYWIERAKPGTFKSIFYKKSKKVINEFREFESEVDRFFNNINSEYKNFKKEFNTFFD